ncbi:MAG TPA: 3'-5' exonuclease, partial [Bacteroidia bacterium]|nr:3'-5' exonuclease [Bacteroidia bacterium]
EFSDGDNIPAIDLNENDPELQRIEVERKAQILEEELGNEAPLRTLDQFMQDIALLTDADKKETPEDLDCVSLMTIHAAKGLEFPYVFIVGVEENLFPNPMSLNSRADLEEERRLFYVAITRAEKRATVTYSSSRYRWGNLTSCEASRFIEEIDPKFIEYANSAARGDVEEFNEPTFGIKKSFAQKKDQPQQKTATIPPRKNLVKASNATSAPIDNSHLKDLQIGMIVKHERFGTGKVAQLEGQFPNTKATVVFEQAGQKQLLLKFAKLDIVEA